MDNSHSESYKSAGVDVTAGYRSNELIRKHVENTRIPGVLDAIGGFGGLFAPDLSGLKEPVLVSGTDGVGTKLRIAFALDKHDTIGIDCVAMCVNDIVCAGAKPLFFLDYLALGKNVPRQVEQIVKGVTDGCVEAGCALVGGETAEMPGFYPVGEYDLAGFSVGIADKSKILDKGKVKAGDAVIGLASSGLHSNGFSLVRKILQDCGIPLEKQFPELGATIGEELLTPTKIYVKSALSLLKIVEVHAIGHITGGGFFENIPRTLPDGLTAVIDKSKLIIPPIFNLLSGLGEIPERDMFNTFNMGTGMCILTPGDKADEATRVLRSAGEDAAIIGEIVKGGDGILLQ